MVKLKSSELFSLYNFPSSSFFPPPLCRKYFSSRAKLHPGRKAALALTKSGAPLVLLIIGGTYMLSIFMQTHMEYKDRKGTSISEREFTLEEEHMKMMKQLDIKNYSLSRIPRPGDDRISTKEANVDRTWREWWNGK